jgi:cytoskeleton protein RodZ
VPNPKPAPRACGTAVAGTAATARDATVAEVALPAEPSVGPEQDGAAPAPDSTFNEEADSASLITASVGDEAEAGAVVSGNESAAPASEQTAVVSSEAQGVVFDFVAPCWVDVRDSTGRKVLYGGIGGGERHVLEGDPPYKVVLGDREAVTITINGQPMEPPPGAGDRRVARFSLDPDDFGIVSAGLDR